MNDREKTAVLEAEGLTKNYGDGSLSVSVLKEINLKVNQGERVAILGSSGSGKSTLLHLLGGLDTPTSGSLKVDGYFLHELTEKDSNQLRNASLGFVYQHHHLLADFTALENVSMPLLVQRHSTSEIQQRAEEILVQVGLQDRLIHKPGELSGGERQRVALARALVTKPSCVLADEPTGNLDGQTAASVFELMLEINKVHGTSLVVVTHDTALAKKMDRVLELTRGTISSV